MSKDVSNHTSPSAAPAPAPLARLHPLLFLRVLRSDACCGVGSTAGRDHLPYFTPLSTWTGQTWFNRSGSGISAWINRMMYSPSAVDIRLSLTSLPTTRVQLEYVRRKNHRSILEWGPAMNSLLTREMTSGSSKQCCSICRVLPAVLVIYTHVKDPSNHCTKSTCIALVFGYFPLYPAKFAASTAPMLKAVAGGNVEFPNAGSKCLTPWYKRHNSHCVTDRGCGCPYSNEPMSVAYLDLGLG
ncbi:hypothetical protein Bca52824_041597 [Brassica carinata]|uniref:Uncharacterized protein n=1 Tax=Brassica carinata TaxID=52824 RepID=A0A8X7RVQ7_BRACI|nr:hypothetical protein Bca52824_041597 [Brassica carinata]